LVHECFLRMSRALEQGEFPPEGFRSYATRTIQAALVDHIRREGRLRRGGALLRITLNEQIPEGEDPDALDLLDLDAALLRLSEAHPIVARVVQLRYFGGLTEEQVAEELGVARRTVTNYWQFGRAWLRRELRHGVEGS
jgi:RNA polymerase sigma factor (TIGR02999 family)